ncbi:MAG: hypothetical protein ACI9FN_002888 [Saprospiraceae bacterium]|jgi:hypothetical protein
MGHAIHWFIYLFMDLDNRTEPRRPSGITGKPFEHTTFLQAELMDTYVVV